MHIQFSTFFKKCFLSLFIVSFFSCTEVLSDQNGEQSVTSTSYCEVSFSMSGYDNSEARTALPQKLVKEDLYYVIDAKTSDGSKSTTYPETNAWKYNDLLGERLRLSAGNWRFTLSAYKDKEKTVLLLISAPIVKEIKTGKNKISFEMHEPDSGTGEFSMKLTVSPDVTVASATLCKLDGTPVEGKDLGDLWNETTDGAMVQNWTQTELKHEEESEDENGEKKTSTVYYAEYTIKNIKKGYYMLTWNLSYKNEEEPRSFRSLASIAPGNTSTESYDVSEAAINDPDNKAVVAYYSVFYDLNVADESLVTIPEGISLEDKTLYKKDDLVTIRTFDLKREGYNFVGWRTDSTHIYEVPTDKDSPVTFNMPAANVTLTASWIPSGSTLYKVRYWQQKLNDAGTAVSGTDTTITEVTTSEENATCPDYELINTIPQHGTTGTATKSTVELYAGFTSQPVSEKIIEPDGSTVVDVFYNRNANTVYSVTHYLQDLNETGTAPAESYKLDSDSTEKKSGITGTWTNATAKSYTGFTKKDFEQKTIAADGTTVVEIYYTRNTNTAYTVKHWLQNLNEERTDTTNTYTEDEKARETKAGTTLGTTAAEAQTFIGFTAQNFSQTTIAADGKTVVDIYYNRNPATVYTVHHHLQNLNEDGSAAQTYTVDSAKNETKSGITGAWTKASARIYIGFTAQRIDQTCIAADGSTVVDIFYNRDSNTAYTVKHYKQDLNETGTAPDKNYTLALTEQESGMTGTLTHATANSYPGFTAQPFEQKTIAADGTTVVKIQYTRNTNTVYTVKHWLQDLNGDLTGIANTHTEDEKARETKAGTTLGTTAAKAQTYIGFTAQNFTQTTIAADGSTVVNIYYDRNSNTTYTVHHHLQNLNEDGSAAQTYTVDSAKDETKSGITGTWTKATARSYTGFTAQRIDQTYIAADGKAIVDIYYNRNMYAVTYNDGVESETIGVPEVSQRCFGATVTVASFVPLRTGYTFAKWNYSDATSAIKQLSANETFEMPASDVTLTAKWTSNTNTAYTVKHLLQNLNEERTDTTNTYTEDKNASETKYGITIGTTDAQAKTYTGFTKKDFSQKTIAADGSTVVEIFYDRISYAVTYNDGVDGETIVVPETAQWCYGATVAVASFVPARTGYTFLGWGKVENASSVDYNSGATFTMGAAPVTLYALWKENTATISVTWESGMSDTQPFTYEIRDGNHITFTAPDGYKMYTWYKNNSVVPEENSATFAWNTTNVPSGVYYITLLAQDNSGKLVSSTMTVKVNK